VGVGRAIVAVFNRETEFVVVDFMDIATFR
jgi:hypothetical protein